MKTTFLILGIFSTGALFLPLVFAETPSITLSPKNSTYTHGDFVNFYINADKIGQNATLYIGDDFGKKVKILDFKIEELESHFIFPFSLDPSIYQEGKYFLYVEYGNKTNSIEFNVVNSDKIVIPIPDRTVIILELNSWLYQNQDVNFVRVIQYFQNKNFIEITNTIDLTSVDKLSVPEWIKNNALWWINGKISDNDFSSSIQYLIREQIITI